MKKPTTATRSDYSLLEWATQYLKYSEKKYVPKTFLEKKKAFSELLNSEDIDPYMSVRALEPLMVLDHLQIQAQNRSGRAANNDRKNLSHAWSWGVTYLNLPLLNPIKVVERFSEDRISRIVPTIDEFLAVYNHVTVPQDKLLLWMYLQTGARRDELFRLRWRDVDYKQRRIRLFWRKNQKGQWNEAWIPVKEALLSMLRVQQKKTGFMDLVFLNFQGSEKPQYWVPFINRQHWLKNLCQEVGVKEFGFHGIRHLFASILVAKDVNVTEVQKLLRHTNLTTTQRYIHSLKKENREVLAALPDLDDASLTETKNPVKTQETILLEVAEIKKPAKHLT